MVFDQHRPIGTWGGKTGNRHNSDRKERGYYGTER
jgi:hypothetical protein